MTKIDYSQLHDSQINMMVCKKLGLGLSSYARIITQDDATILLDDNKTLVDYCNNPADAYPVIYKNGISIGIYGYGEWGAGTIKHTYIDGVNPLRAAMIVFLEMQ